MIAGSHLHRVHGWTLGEYREAFRLLKGVPTVAAGVSTALAEHTRRRVRAGELPADFMPEWRARRGGARYRVQRWRSLAVVRPDLAAQLHPTRNGDLDPVRRGDQLKPEGVVALRQLRPRVGDLRGSAGEGGRLLGCVERIQVFERPMEL